jgi:hypothetical protein
MAAVAPVGQPTRGTTGPNRLRRVDRWLLATHGALLRTAPMPLVVDLGFGASPVTTIELRCRLAAVRPDVRVIGVDIDPTRVAAARSAANEPWLEFRRGGFDLGGLRPEVVRAMNVLRQYDESDVDGAWAAMRAALAPDGVVVEGTSDEPGRLAAWVALGPDGPRTLTLAADLSTLDTPARFAERLPKVLVHRNMPGERVHALLTALSTAWRIAAPYGVFGPRQRWCQTVAAVRTQGWPVLDRPARWRHGELTVAWAGVAPR